MDLNDLNKPLDLNRPLGLGRAAPSASARALQGLPWGRIGFGGLGLLFASLIGFAIITDDGMGGEPYAIAQIEVRKPAPAEPASPATAGAATSGANSGASADDVTGSTIRIRRGSEMVEEASGVKVVRQGGGSVPDALIIAIPQASVEVGLAPAPDRRLIEKGRHGPLPRIGPDGAKAMDVYARPFVTGANIRPGAPKVAILIGGMGLNAEATQAALGVLPRAITLGFAPYGPDLARQTARARTEGHEVILQAPLEGFGGEAEAPAHLLRASDTSSETLNRLHWHMSRFPGYVGIAGYLGGKFTANGRAFTPVLSEIADRGLFYFDDGTSTRSLALSLGADSSTPIVRADIVIDARIEAIDDALIRLERLARDKGSAVGSANGLPIVIEKIARFAKAMEGRGIALAPVSSLAAIPRPASARTNQ